jgi:hypothetical protein
VRRREIDGCPIAGALQMIGDKWTLLIARDLAAGNETIRSCCCSAGPFTDLIFSDLWQVDSW